MATQRLTFAEATGNLGDVQQGPATGRRFRALLITAGWGSSGYYSAEVLQRDGAKVWPAGTQSYLDHPSLSEAVDLPERSVKDLASRLVTDPVWDETLQGLVAEVEVFPQWTGLLNEDFAKQIGLSIRAYGTAEHGEAEGRSGPIITSLDEGISVDWVTQAGAGGRVLELIESARTAPRPVLQEKANVGHYLESRIHSHFTNMADDMFGEGRLTRPERIGLSGAIGDGLKAFTTRVTADHPQLYERGRWQEPDLADGHMSEARRRRLREADGMTANELSTALADAVRETYGGEGLFTWVRDSTDQWVVFSVEDDTDCDLYQQTYTVDAAAQEVTLTGDPVEVIARTTYTPAPPDPDEPDEPALQPNTAPGGEMDGMGMGESTNAPGSAPADTRTKEGAMPEITEEQQRQLDEAAAVRAQLDEATRKLAEAAAGTETAADVAKRVAVLEESLKESKATNLRLQNDKAARAQVAETLKTSALPDIAHTRVAEAACRNLPLGDDGSLDAAAFTETINAAVTAEQTYLASLAEASGAGLPRGLGAAPSLQVADADLDKQLTEAFAGLGMDDKAALTAVNGRG